MHTNQKVKHHKCLLFPMANFCIYNQNGWSYTHFLKYLTNYEWYIILKLRFIGKNVSTVL